MSKYKRTPLGLIPQTWKVGVVGDFGKVITGSTPPTKNGEFFNGPHMFVTPSDLGIEKFILSSDRTLTNAGLKKSRMAPAGSVLCVCIGSIGKVGILEKDAGFNQQINAVVPSDHHGSEFLYYYLELRSDSFARLAGKQVVPIINKSQFSSIPIAMPDTREQTAISEALGHWDRAINITKRLISAKQELCKGLMQQLLTGKQWFPGFLGPWKTVRIRELFKAVKRPVNWDDDAKYRLVSIRRRSGGLFLRSRVKGNEVKTKDLCEIKEGDFLISRRQVVHGACSIVKKEFDGMCVSNSYLTLRVRDPKVLDVAFFDWLSKTSKMYNIFFKSSHGVHIEKLFFTPDYYLKQTIRLPGSIQEQHKIVSALDITSRMISQLERKYKLLHDLRKGLMHKLLTGKVRVKMFETKAAE